MMARLVCAVASEGNYFKLSESTAVIVSREDDLPPTVCPDLVPAGWRLTDEVLDFQVGTEDWAEVYLLERDD